MVHDFEALEVLDKHYAHMLSLLYLSDDYSEVRELRAHISGTLKQITGLVDQIGQDRAVGEQGS